MRVKFKLNEQRKFLDLVVSRLNCVSLRGVLQFGFAVSYNSLKSYYTERRALPKTFFDDLCYIAKINPNRLKVEYLEDNWGKVKGGKIGKRK